MNPMKKSLTALAATALIAGVGYATAQSTDPSAADNGAAPQAQTTQPADTSTAPAPAADTSMQGQTTTTTTTDVTTQVLPAPPTGVTELARPKGTVTATDKEDNGALGAYNNVMTSGVTDGATRPSVGDHATPPIQAEPKVLSVTTQRTVAVSTPPAPEPQAAPQPEPAPAPAEEAPAPMPAPKADRN